MGYLMELSDKQWFNLICGMQAGLMCRYNKAPVGSATVINKGVDPDGNETSGESNKASGGASVRFTAFPLTKDYSLALETEGSGSIGVRGHISAFATAADILELNIDGIVDEEMRATIITLLLFYANNSHPINSTVHKTISMTEKQMMMAWGAGYEPSGDYIYAGERSIAGYDVSFKIRYACEWDYFRGLPELCIVGGGAGSGEDDLYCEWRISVSGANLLGNSLDVMFALGSYDGGRLYPSYFTRGYSTFTPADGVNVVFNEYGSCGARLEVDSIPADGVLGVLRFGPFGNKVIEGSNYSFCRTEGSMVVAYLKVNDEVMIDHRKQVAWANWLKGDPFVVYYGAEQSQWGFMAVNKVVSTESASGVSYSTSSVIKKIADIRLTAPSGANAEGTQSVLDVLNSDGQVYYVGTEESGVPGGLWKWVTDESAASESDIYSNEYGYVAWSGDISSNEDKEIYVGIREVETGEIVTAAMPLALTAGINSVSVKIPLVNASENGLVGEYELVLIDSVEYAAEGGYSSVDEAKADGGLFGESEISVDAGATLIFQSVEGAPALGENYGRGDGVIIDDEMDVVIRKEQGDVDTGAVEIIYVGDDIGVTARREFNGLIEGEDNIEISDGLVLESRRVFKGLVEGEDNIEASDGVTLEHN